ncbi:tRNA (uridine(54)-C5)-methyltransferase TrmA, partial [Pectobacterium brasiliense]|nr:tRNA (uridine(54)-C5)-methyltransferase TrmA [Pectobacterium brasiliense]
MTPEILPIEQNDDQRAEKTERLRGMIAPFNAPEPVVFRSHVSHKRKRAEFRIWHE